MLRWLAASQSFDAQVNSITESKVTEQDNELGRNLRVEGTLLSTTIEEHPRLSSVTGADS